MGSLLFDLTRLREGISQEGEGEGMGEGRES